MIVNYQYGQANKSGIYKIWNILDDRIYIGSAVRIRKRKDKHIMELRMNKHHSNHLQNFVNKYGIDKLIFEVIEIVEDKTKLIEREQHYLDTLKPQFNSCLIAGNQLSIKRSDEFKKNLSERNKGRLLSDETKQKKSESMMRYWKDNPDKLLLFKASKRRKGYKHTQDSKDKMSRNSTFKLKQYTIDEIINLYNNKVSIEDISKTLNISKYSVYRYLQSNNIISKVIKNKIILQYDLEDNFIKEYNSVRETRDAGFHTREVMQCCNGERISYKNFKFKLKIN